MTEKLQEAEQQALDSCISAVKYAQEKLGGKVRLHILMERRVKSTTLNASNFPRYQTSVLYSETVKFSGCLHEGPEMIAGGLSIFGSQQMEPPSPTPCQSTSTRPSTISNSQSNNTNEAPSMGTAPIVNPPTRNKNVVSPYDIQK